MELLTARQYARIRDLPERTVRGWRQAGDVPGAVQIGRAWAATLEQWDAAAAKERSRPGRRDNEPRTKKAPDE